MFHAPLLEHAAKLLKDAHETNTAFWLTNEENPANPGQIGRMMMAGKFLAEATIATDSTRFREALERMYKDLQMYNYYYQNMGYKRYLNDFGFDDDALGKFILALNQWDGTKA